MQGQTMRRQLVFDEQASFILKQLSGPGAFLIVADWQGSANVMAIGWGLLGPFYHGHPVFVVAVRPQCFTWHILEETDDFVVAVARDKLKDALTLCGTKSGRDLDKFKAAGLTPIPSYHVRAPSIGECPVNVECRIYHRQHPPHGILTPEHRERPLSEQHTIYFGEVLGTYSGMEEQR
jgi:flavin reductase (DIM6/NTAB) family NADH-FMN oxidoreductase RutF